MIFIRLRRGCFEELDHHTRDLAKWETTLRDFTLYVETRTVQTCRANAYQNDLELGATEAAQQHYQRHVVSPKAVTQRKLDFERARPRWLREMLGEATGVFFYGKRTESVYYPPVHSLTDHQSTLELPPLPPSFSTRPMLPMAVFFKSDSHLHLA